MYRWQQRSLWTSEQVALSLSLPDGLGPQDRPHRLVKHLQNYDLTCILWVCLGLVVEWTKLHSENFRFCPLQSFWPEIGTIYYKKKFPSSKCVSKNSWWRLLLIYGRLAHSVHLYMQRCSGFWIIRISLLPNLHIKKQRTHLKSNKYFFWLFSEICTCTAL